MTLDKEKQIRASLANKEYREALAVEHVNTTLAIQIRNMRENNEWKQSDIAQRLGKHQETISQWENPDYGRYSITSLKALAAAFDVALLVKFTSFSELVSDMMNLSTNRLSPPSYSKEQEHIASSAVFSPSAGLPEGVDANSLYNDINKLVPGTFPSTDTMIHKTTDRTILKEPAHA
jgi:transcriptional regulator with XRE-family HTH domain